MPCAYTGLGLAASESKALCEPVSRMRVKLAPRLWRARHFDGTIYPHARSIHQRTTSQPNLDELISLSEAAELCGFTQPHLALQVRNGELMGNKNWT